MAFIGHSALNIYPGFVMVIFLLGTVKGEASFAADFLGYLYDDVCARSGSLPVV